MEQSKTAVSLVQSDPKINLYHRHIIADINHLEQRANKYIEIRRDLIKQKGRPIEQKIHLINEQIKKEKILEETSEETMEARDDVQTLRADIQKYKDITHYYKKHLDELQRVFAEEENRKESLQKEVEQLRSRYLVLKKTNIHEFAHSFESTRVSMHKSKDVVHSQSRQPVPPPSHVQSLMSPTSRHPLFKPPLDNNVKLLKEKIVSFNLNDRLIKDCFEVKKTLVQRMIGQLQSRLVKKKKLFVKLCQAISKKETHTITQKDFSQLDCDEIFTLIISFPSLTRKFEAELQQKRNKVAQASNYVKAYK